MKRSFRLKNLLLKNFISLLFTDLYKISLVRFIIVYSRFIFLFYILKKNKLLYSLNQDVKNLILFKEKKIDNNYNFRIKKNETTIEHNLNYSKNIFLLKKKYNQFIGNKGKSLVSPLESLDFIDKKNAKLLSIGPRNEGELFLIRSYGYNWKNIYAIDLHSYSSKIKLCDMHNINFENNYFDIVLSGWTLAYSSNKNKALEEIRRVAKNNAVICIGYTYLPEERKYITKENDYLLLSNQQLIDYFKIEDHDIYFNFNSFKINKKQTRHSILIFRIIK